MYSKPLGAAMPASASAGTFDGDNVGSVIDDQETWMNRWAA